MTSRERFRIYNAGFRGRTSIARGCRHTPSLLCALAHRYDSVIVSLTQRQDALSMPNAINPMVRKRLPGPEVPGPEVPGASECTRSSRLACAAAIVATGLALRRAARPSHSAIGSSEPRTLAPPSAGRATGRATAAAGELNQNGLGAPSDRMAATLAGFGLWIRPLLLE